MAAVFTIDDRQFRAVLNKYLEVNKREFAFIVNTKLKFISGAAIRETRAADAEKIRLALGQTSTRITSKRTGRRLKSAVPVFSQSGGAYAIVTAWAKRRGVKLPRPGLRDFVEKQRGRRVSGAGFIKSGWVASLETFKRLSVRGKNGLMGAKKPKVYGRPKGKARPARVSFFPSGWIQNTAILPLSKHSYNPGQPMKHAQAGLQRAYNEEVRSMISYMAPRLQKLANKVNYKR